MLSPDGKEKFVEKHIPGMQPDSVGGLYLNVIYENNEMNVVTGTSMNIFTMDKTLEREWDECVKQFLKKHDVVCSEK